MFSYSGLVSIREHNFIYTPHIDSSHRWLFPLVAQEMVTHEDLNKMDDILQTTIPTAFSWMKILEYWIKFTWNVLQSQ